MALYLGILFPGERNLLSVLELFKEYIHDYSFGLDEAGNTISPWDPAAKEVIFSLDDNSISLNKNGVYYSRRLPELKSDFMEYALACHSLVEEARFLGGVATGCEGDPLEVDRIVEEVERWFGKSPAPSGIDWKYSINRLLTLHDDEIQSRAFYDIRNEDIPFRRLIDAFIWNQMAVGNVAAQSRQFTCWDGTEVYVASECPVTRGAVWRNSTFRVLAITWALPCDKRRESELLEIFRQAADSSLWVRVRFFHELEELHLTSNIIVSGSLSAFAANLRVVCEDLADCVKVVRESVG